MALNFFARKSQQQNSEFVSFEKMRNSYLLVYISEIICNFAALTSLDLFNGLRSIQRSVLVD